MRALRMRIDSEDERDCMGKYFLAWLLGVPAGLLIILYLVMHL